MYLCFLVSKRPYDGQGKGGVDKKPKGEANSSSSQEKIPCTNCNKTHKGGAAECTYKPPKKDNQSGGGSSSGNKSAKQFLSPRNKGKRKYFSVETDNFNELMNCEQTLNKLSEESFACEYPMQILTTNNTLINVIALIDTGANSSNYNSQHLFDRLTEGGNKSHQVSGTVRGGLQAKGQRVDITHAISFSLSYLAEHLDECNTLTKIHCNKTRTHFATAKLLPIDYDLIIGLPSIRRWQLIKTIPSIFIEENKVPIVVSARPCVGDSQHTISATPADTLFLTTESEEVRISPPFSPSSTTWEDADVSTRYEKSTSHSRRRYRGRF